VHRLVEIDHTMALSHEPIVEIGEQKRIGPYGVLFIATLFEKLKVGVDMRMQRARKAGSAVWTFREGNAG
jgi:hypothetical protein